MPGQRDEHYRIHAYQELPEIPDRFLALSVARNEDSNLSIRMDDNLQELEKKGMLMGIKNLNF